MNNLKKFFSKKKKSILSLMLALVLALSFNYSPISLLSDMIKTNAYKSSTEKTYYQSSSTGNENNIGEGTIPDSLAEYFQNSSTNFNIYKKYTEFFNDLYARHVHDYLSELTHKVGSVDDTEQTTWVPYNTLYKEFLESVGYETLIDYYTKNTSKIKDNKQGETFKEYVEYFVSHEINYTYKSASDSEGSTKYVYPYSEFRFTENSNEYRIQFYNAISNELTPSQSIKNEEILDKDGNPTGETARDGIEDADKFYEQSISYGRLKEYIDGEVSEIFAIYTYDKETQNKNVAAILAQLAPGSMEYYYEEKTYKSVTELDISYETTNGHKTVYYLLPKNDPTSITFINVADAAGVEVADIKFDEDGKIKTDLEKYPLKYRPIGPDDDDYVEGYTAYYKYKETPYAPSDNKNYYIYVVVEDDYELTEDEIATYDFLYIDVIRESELAEANKDKDNPLYINLPAPTGTYEQTETSSNYTIGLHDHYFIKALGISPTSNSDESTTGSTVSQKSDVDRFINIIKTFTEEDGSGNRVSKLYLKHKTTSKNYVYVQTGEKDDLAAVDYDYIDYVIEKDFANMSKEELADYYEVTTGNYYDDEGGITVYHEKIKKEYQSTTNIQYVDGEYETRQVPNIPFETTTIASTEYETEPDGSKKIFAYVPTGTDNTTGITSINESTLEEAVHNEYVKVPEKTVKALNLDESFTYYYKHKLTENVKKIYIVVNIDKFDDEKDNEVYKNLNYTVIPSEDYNGVKGYNFNDYIAVEKTDANYNENFKLYYKYKSQAELSNNIYVQNKVTCDNAIYVVKTSVSPTDKTTYKDNGRNFIPISQSEYEDNYQFYVQLSDEVSPSLSYTLYYKYNATSETKRVIYQYSASSSSSSSSTYETFTETTDGYAASDYELITPYLKDGKTINPDYVQGTDLYYKKIRDTENSDWYTADPQETIYSYTTSSTISLSANSYYVVSFYVYTNGVYTNNTGAENEETALMQASFYLEDSKGYITNAKVEHISTEGKWQKHYLFVATNSLVASSVKLTMYMGDNSSIMGTATNFDFADGTVMFDDIRVIKINQTDYNKQSIDDKTVLTTAPADETPEESEGSEPSVDPVNDPAPIEYVDDYGNKIFAWSASTRANDTVNAWTPENQPSKNTFEDNFNIDNLQNEFSNINFANAYDIDAYSPLENLWQIYISRDVSGQGNNYILDQYQKAYADGKLSVSVIDESSILKDKEATVEDDDKTIDSDAPTEEDDDKAFIEETFKKGNKILKLENSSRQLNLGLISNYFTINQSQYYKLTVWIYSTEENATATLKVSSILKTSTTLTNGSLISSTANVSANINDYDKTPTNEYGWIPVSFYIEGNALHSQNCYLTLCADKDYTIYFDNISIEKITSAAYDSANSDSDKTTFCISLTPSTSVVSAGVTNGYFNNVTVTDNYNSINGSSIDYSLPRKAESWTVSTTSTGVVAGVVPTSTEYLALDKNFFTEYNAALVPSNPLKNNIYAISAPLSVSNPLNSHGGNDKTTYQQLSTYSIYSSSISLSSSTTYKLSFEFYKGTNFAGNMFAEIYSSSVKTENLISRLSISASDMTNEKWNEFAFYIGTDASSATVYIKIGIENAVGTCFIRNVSNVSQTQTLDVIRDNMISTSDNSDESTTNIYEKESFKNVRFINLNAFEFSIHENEKTNTTNTYETKEFSNSLANTSTFTTGDTGIAVASYYTTSTSTTYTVTIDKVEYYIKGIKVDGSEELVYKMYSDSNYTEEVTKLNGKTVTVDGTTKVIVGSEKPTEYTITETEKTNYHYNFKDNLTINNTFIDSSELKNDYSEKVLVLANSYSTDYTLATPKYSTTLSKTSYYVLKVYVKTSSFDNEFGLNIDMDSSISRKWTNIDTTDAKYDDLRDENGFVCYQILISTNDNSISSFSIKFSLGNEKSTGTGYAIIADVELEKFSTEKLFNEYALNYEDVDKDSNDTIIKSYFGTKSSDSSSSGTDDSSKSSDSDSSITWATFFYIFSSLLLGIVLILALVATIIKKHPIKVVKQEQNEHERDITSIVTDSSITKKPRNKKQSNEEEDDQVETEEVVKKDDGFV